MKNIWYILSLFLVTCDNPLYVLPHSKEVLLAAIQNDTEFLSTQSVMDYSLLVGLDTKNKELVLGIIGKFATLSKHHLIIFFCLRLYKNIHLGQETRNYG